MKTRIGQVIQAVAVLGVSAWAGAAVAATAYGPIFVNCGSSGYCGNVMGYPML